MRFATVAGWERYLVKLAGVILRMELRQRVEPSFVTRTNLESLWAELAVVRGSRPAGEAR